MRLSFILFSTVVLGALLGCGGSQQPSKSAKCREALAQIIAEDEQKICDPILVEQFEGRITDWRDACLGYADLKERSEVDKKLTKSRECSENKSRWDAKRKECSQRVEEIAFAGDCLEEACVTDLQDLKKVISDCSAPEIDGPHMETAKKLMVKLEERVAKRDVLKALAYLMDECVRIHEMAGEIDTQALMDRILAELAKQKELQEIPKEGSEVGGARQDALVSCQNVLEPAVETLTQNALTELDDEKLKKKPEKWLARLQKLEDLDARLKEIGAEALFPGSTEPLKAALEKLKDIKIGYTGAKEERPIADEDRTAQTDLSFFKTSENRCKKLSKDKDRFEAKTESHKKKGNEKKAAAYKKKLDKTTEELDALKAEIKRVIETTQISKEKLDAILKKLDKAGCPAGK
jgi:hypothetical protein